MEAIQIYVTLSTPTAFVIMIADSDIIVAFLQLPTIRNAVALVDVTMAIIASQATTTTEDMLRLCSVEILEACGRIGDVLLIHHIKVS